jgi:hypothetical protein
MAPIERPAMELTVEGLLSGRKTGTRHALWTNKLAVRGRSTNKTIRGLGLGLGLRKIAPRICVS